MAEADEGGARRREPLVLGISGALIGVVVAVALVALLGLGGNGSAGASGSPDSLPSFPAAPSLTAEVSPSIALPVSPEPTLVPAPTVAPTAVRTPAPTKTPRPTPTPNTNPTIVSWVVPQLEDCTGTSAGQVTVSWVVRRATGVTISIDGPGIFDSYATTSDEITLPFGCSFEARHTYTLRTTGGSGTAATSTKTINVRPPSVVSFAMGPGGVAHCPSASGTVGIDLDFEVRAATGAELRDEGLYATYSQKVINTSGISYDCSKAQQVFKLTTTGGYGDPASKSITVNRVTP